MLLRYLGVISLAGFIVCVIYYLLKKLFFIWIESPRDPEADRQWDRIMQAKACEGITSDIVVSRTKPPVGGILK